MSSWEQIQTQYGPARAPAVAPPPPVPQGAVPIVSPKDEGQGQNHEQVEAADAAAVPAVVEVGAEDAGLIAEELNKSMAVLNSRVSFSIDEVTNSTVIKVIDNDTGDVIRQVPPEIMLNLLQRMAEMVGLLLDERA